MHVVSNSETPKPRSFKEKTLIEKIAFIILFPIHAPVELLHSHVKLSQQAKHCVHCLVGIAVAIAGVIISKMHWFPPEHLLHLSSDFVGYFLHGIGLAPVGKVIFTVVGFEE